MAVNTRLVPAKDVSEIRVRRFDGAETWRFLD